MTSCTCADVADFTHRSVKMFPLNIWSEYRNLVKKIISFVDDINNMLTKFPRSWMGTPSNDGYAETIVMIPLL